MPGLSGHRSAPLLAVASVLFACWTLDCDRSVIDHVPAQPRWSQATTSAGGHAAGGGQGATAGHGGGTGASTSSGAVGGGAGDQPGGAGGTASGVGGAGGQGGSSTSGGSGGGVGGSAPTVMPDFQLPDVNATSASYNTLVSPRDYLEQVSGWYFGSAT